MLGGAACSKSNGSSSSSGSSSPSSGGSSSSSPSPMATIASLTGVDTSVTLDPSTAMVLKQNMVSVAPVAPAKASMANGGVTVSFPITGGNVQLYDKSVQAQGIPYIQGKITHTGGITFSAGGKMLSATDFVVDPGTSMLMATVGGQQVPLLILDGTNVQVSKDSAGHVVLDGTIAKLTQAAADALNKTFGVSLFKEGIPLGTVHLVAAG